MLYNIFMYRKSFIDVYLKNKFTFDEAKSEVDFALDVLFNFTYKEFMLGKTLENWQIAKIEKVINERVSTRKPIQQIIGQAYFYNRKFFVDENTLIPRPETELLVSEVLSLLKNQENAKILDIGTGSGCIPLTLALERKDFLIHSVDISIDAIETAKKNALLHNVFETVKFYKSDLYEKVENKYNLIVSNPPYIPLKDKDTLQIEVRNFDPPSALFAPDEEGIDFYKRIIQEAKHYLEKNGLIVFELGINQAILVKELLEQNDFIDIKIEKDFNSIERVISAKLKC